LLYLCFLTKKTQAMHETIEGIILKRIPYNDKSSIVYLYTQNYGFLPVIVRKSNSSKNNHAAFIIPMGIIQTEIKLNHTRDIQSISKINSEYYLLSLRESYDKMNIAQFLSEFLYQILKYPHTDQNLYLFLKEWILKLDTTPIELCSNIHIFALIKLLTFLGIEPENNFSQKLPYFDLKQACFTEHLPSDYIEQKNISELWSFFLSSHYENALLKKVSRNNKNHFIKSIMNYYTLHLDIKLNFTTLEVLQAIYEDYPQNA